MATQSELWQSKVTERQALRVCTLIRSSICAHLPPARWCTNLSPPQCFFISFVWLLCMKYEKLRTAKRFVSECVSACVLARQIRSVSRTQRNRNKFPTSVDQARSMNPMRCWKYAVEIENFLQVGMLRQSVGWPRWAVAYTPWHKTTQVPNGRQLNFGNACIEDLQKHKVYCQST